MPKHAPTHSSARTQAAAILLEWLTTEQFPDRMLGTRHRNHALLTEIVYGTLRHTRELQWIIDACTERSPKPEALAILYAGLYQLLYLDQVDEFAVVNESVESAARLGWPKLKGLINAVLRRVLRDKDILLGQLAAQPLAVRISHPDHLVSRWQASFGTEPTESLCNWNNQRPTTTLRVACNRIPLGTFQEHLQKAGIVAMPHPARPDECLVLPRGTAVPDVPGFEQGWFIVQDPSTLAAVDLLDPQPEETILDLCASPGGKTVAIAERMGDTGTLVATDMHADRMPRLKENLARMQASRVRIDQVNAADPNDLAALRKRHALQTVDGILIDAPCSNTGVIQRRPDARYRVTRKRLLQLARLQRSILTSAASLLSSGSRMVYSTCSLEKEENEGLIDAWLAENPSLRKRQEVHLVPPNSQTDGAYACVLIRK